MQFKLTVFLSLALVAVVPCVTAKVNQRGPGGCPELQPESNVEFDRLLGMWYLVQTTSLSSSCVTYNITKNDQGKYQVTITEQHDDSFYSLESHIHSSTVDLTPSNERPGIVTSHIPNTRLTKTLTILNTDHENYLGIYICKPIHVLYLEHSWTVEILSRTPTLSLDQVDKIETQLLSDNIETSLLQKVTHVGCPKPGEAIPFDVNSIKPEFRDLYLKFRGESTTPPINEV